MKKLPHSSSILISFLIGLLVFLSACGNSTANPNIQPSMVPTATSGDTPAPNNFKGFSFETSKDTEGWDTSEHDFKKASYSIESAPVPRGKGSLSIETLLATNSEINSHTETKVDMDHALPEGYSKLGPYDWSGKAVSIWIFIPKELGNKIKVGIYVADQTWHNDRQVIENLSSEYTGYWFQLSLMVGHGNHTDFGFTPKSIRAIGVRIDVIDSSLNFTGKFFVDDVVLPE